LRRPTIHSTRRRFARQSVALGIRNAILDQQVEVSALKPQFATFLGVGGRRPIDAVLT